MNSFRGGYSRVLQFCLSLACLSHICTRTEAICYKHGKLLNCLNSIPRRSELEGAGMQISVQINNYGGELIADLPEEKNSYSVNSLQIFNSTIRKIMPRFFSEFSSNGLELLLFNGVSGEFELNAQTLSGLEEVLTTIRVTNSRPLRDISYFAELKKLTKLHLGLTDLAEVPANFATVLSRLISMDLTRNKLTRLPWDALASRIQAVEFQRSRLSDNQWHCDCTLLPLLQVPEDSLVSPVIGTVAKVTGGKQKSQQIKMILGLVISSCLIPGLSRLMSDMKHFTSTIVIPVKTQDRGIPMRFPKRSSWFHTG